MKTLYDTKVLYEALHDAQIAISLRLWNLDELDCRSYLILLLPAASERTPDCLKNSSTWMVGYSQSDRMQAARGLELLHYRIVLNQDSLRVNSTTEAQD